MSRNHRNRSWRSHWSIDESGRSATHKSGLVARAVISEKNHSGFDVVLENTEDLDLAIWKIGKLAEQAIRLRLTP